MRSCVCLCDLIDTKASLARVSRLEEQHVKQEVFQREVLRLLHTVDRRVAHVHVCVVWKDADCCFSLLPDRGITVAHSGMLSILLFLCGFWGDDACSWGLRRC